MKKIFCILSLLTVFTFSMFADYVRKIYIYNEPYIEVCCKEQYLIKVRDIYCVKRVFFIAKPKEPCTQVFFNYRDYQVIKVSYDEFIKALMSN